MTEVLSQSKVEHQFYTIKDMPDIEDGNKKIAKNLIAFGSLSLLVGNGMPHQGGHSHKQQQFETGI